MDNASYTALTRQSGLLSEMQAIANNIANASTTGYRAEGVLFAEYIAALGPDAPSLSMASAEVRQTVQMQGALAQTGSTFDLAIEGDGYFMVLTPQGERLTRSGHFTPNENGDLVTAEGYPVADSGGAPMFVPQGTANIGISADGTLSADGQPVGQVGVFMPADPDGMIREDGVRFIAESGTEPALDARIVQGYLEQSNVNPVQEITRMIEVQRAYELGQNLLDREDERIRSVIRDLSRS